MYSDKMEEFEIKVEDFFKELFWRLGIRACEKTERYSLLLY